MLQSVYTNFVQTLNMETLYHSFLDQFIVIVHKERPNTSSFDPIHSARFTDIWLQYQISELITIAKILLICGSHYIPSIDSLTTIASVLIVSLLIELVIYVCFGSNNQIILFFSADDFIVDLKNYIFVSPLGKSPRIRDSLKSQEVLI